MIPDSPRRFALLSAVLLLSGCARAMLAPSAAACPVPGASTRGWKEVPAGAARRATFRVPREFVREGRATGGAAGDAWRAGDLRVSWLEGDFVTLNSVLPLDPKRADRYSSCVERIGGRSAKVVSYRAGDWYYAAAYWADVTPRVGLAVTGTARRVEEQRLALAILRTVRFTR